MPAFPRLRAAALAVCLAVALGACGGDQNPTIEGPATSAPTGGATPYGAVQPSP